MVDGADASGWSDVAAGWAEIWGGFADPVRSVIVRAAGITQGTRVLDAGCGSGEFLRLLKEGGADAVGADPADEMVAIARGAGVEVVVAGIEHLPFEPDSFDVATAVNALQFADDTTGGLRELARVVRPGGMIAIANWAEGSLNDIDVVEAAVARAQDDVQLPDGPLRPAGGIEQAFTVAGLDVMDSGRVDVPWLPHDDQTLVRGVLLGESAEIITELTPVVRAAAEPFRTESGGYVLRNTFRWAIARVDRASP